MIQDQKIISLSNYLYGQTNLVYTISGRAYVTSSTGKHSHSESHNLSF